MKLHQGTKDGEGFTADEIKRNIHTIYMDVTCPWCSKCQPVAMTGYIGGPCVRCGKRTDGSAAAEPGSIVMQTGAAMEVGRG